MARSMMCLLCKQAQFNIKHRNMLTARYRTQPCLNIERRSNPYSTVRPFGRYSNHGPSANKLPILPNCGVLRNAYESALLPYGNVAVAKTSFFAHLHTSCSSHAKKHDKETRALTVRKQYFEQLPSRDKRTFLEAVELYENQGRDRRGHVEFIYAAMKYFEEFGVEKDLEAYKALMNVFPKGQFISTNMFQLEFMHYPKQQQCAIDLLEQMEINGVMPDREMKDIIINAFGKWSYPMRKLSRIMYWVPKFKHLSPWPLPNPAPFDPLELAKLAISRICTVDLQSKVSIFQTKDLKESVEDTWIVNGQSPAQRELLAATDEKVTAYVEGPFLIYIRQHIVNYFILRTDSKGPPDIRTKESMDDVSNISLWMFGEDKAPVDLMKAPSVHEQEDGILLATCATGTSSRDSLLAWIRFLQEENPHLAKIPVIFTLRVFPLTREVVPVNVSDTSVTEAEEKFQVDDNKDCTDQR